MTRTEHLLWVLAEECAEVAQRVSKAARFGLGEVEPGQPDSNAKRIEQEVADLLATYGMLVSMGHLIPTSYMTFVGKAAKVEKFLKYSAECGTLDPESK